MNANYHEANGGTGAYGYPDAVTAYTLQEAADHLAAIVCKEELADGYRVYAYPLRHLRPESLVTDAGIRWDVVPARINITDQVCIDELVVHDPTRPVYPRFYHHNAKRMMTHLDGSIAIGGGEGGIMYTDRDTEADDDNII